MAREAWALTFMDAHGFMSPIWERDCISNTGPWSNYIKTG